MLRILVMTTLSCGAQVKSVLNAVFLAARYKSLASFASQKLMVYTFCRLCIIVVGAAGIVSWDSSRK